MIMIMIMIINIIIISVFVMVMHNATCSLIQWVLLPHMLWDPSHTLAFL